MERNNRQRYAPRLVVALIVLVAVAVFMPGLTAQAGGGTAVSTVDEQDPLNAAQQTSRVNIYMIALDDNGRNGKPVGCGDSVVPVSVRINPTRAPLRAALNQLFAVQNQSYAGRYNALHRSTLSAGRITIVRGRATIELFGDLILGGVCDDPRVVAQIEETARQFANVTSVSVLVNGQPIRDVLAQ